MDAPELMPAIAAFGCATTLDLPTEPIDDAAFRRVLSRAAGQRLVGMMAAAVAADAFAVTDDQRDRLAQTEQRWAVQALHVEQLLLALVDVLSPGGIEYRVFKGPALARTVYPDPSWRPFADVDLLVRGADFDQARSLIVGALGAEQPVPELRPGFDREFGKEALLKVDGRYEIDLHRTFVTGPIGLTIPLEELFQRGSTFELAGRELCTLDPLHAFLQTCINAAVGDFPPRTCSLRDVAQLAPMVADCHDEVAATAARWRCGLALKRALELTQSGLGLDSMPTIAHRAGAVERLGMRSYLTPARSYTRPAASLLAIRGFGPRLRYLRAIVSPQPAYLESRGWSRRAHAKRALTRLGRR